MSLRLASLGSGASTSSPFLSLSFNQDAALFCAGTPQGFRVFNTYPFDESFSRVFPAGGIGLVEMLYRTNILALVGGGPIPAFQPNQVVFWDDHAVAAVGQLPFSEVVVGLKLRRDKIVVVTASMVHIYNFENFDLVAKHPTADNSFGIAVVSSSPSVCVVATLARQVGHARVENYTSKRSIVFKAHDSAIRCMALSTDGSLLATCSVKGTIIRIFDTNSDCVTPVQELRRGSGSADVYSLCFNRDGSMLCTCSDHGTLHVFCTNVRTKYGMSDHAGAAATAVTPSGGALAEGSAEYQSVSSTAPGQAVSPAQGGGGVAGVPDKNQKSMLSFAASILPRYFSSEWSFAQFKGPDVPSICAFNPSKVNSVILITCEGEYFEVVFDPEKGGACSQVAFHRFRPGRAGSHQPTIGRTPSNETAGSSSSMSM